MATAITTKLTLNNVIASINFEQPIIKLPVSGGVADEGLVPDGQLLPGRGVVEEGADEWVAVLEAQLLAGDGGRVHVELLVAEPGPLAERGVVDLEEALVGLEAAEEARALVLLLLGGKGPRIRFWVAVVVVVVVVVVVRRRVMPWNKRIELGCYLGIVNKCCEQH